MSLGEQNLINALVLVEQLSLKNTWLCALNDKSMKLCKYFLYIIKLFFGHRTTFNLTFGDL